MRFLKPLLWLGLIIAAIAVWSSDDFQSRFFPRSYWQNRVEQAEQKVTLTRDFANKCTLELESMRRTFDIDVAKLVQDGTASPKALEITRLGYQVELVMCQGTTADFWQAQRDLADSRQYLLSLK